MQLQTNYPKWPFYKKDIDPTPLHLGLLQKSDLICCLPLELIQRSYFRKAESNISKLPWLDSPFLCAASHIRRRQKAGGRLFG
jgi:hypothetical protein